MFEIEHQREGFRNAAARDQQAVIAENERSMITQIGDETLLFSLQKRDTFIIMISDTLIKLQSVLTDRQEAIGQARYRHASQRMGVHDAAYI